jgi:hypothetical protein
MNREIKFRAWDTKDNEMYFPQVLAFGLDLKIVKHSGIICKVVYGKKGACFSLFDVRLGETDLYVITDLSARYMEVIGNVYENPELLTN